MGAEPRDGGADVEAVYRTGFSGNYPSPYLTPRDLKVLSELCLRGEKVICNIEAFEIDGEFDVPRIDLGVYGEDLEQKLNSWRDRASASAAIVNELLLSVSKEANPIMFVVWLDWARM